MSFLRKLRTYLEGQLTAGGYQIKPTVHYMGEDVKEGVLLRQAVPVPVNAELPGFYEGSFQVVVRVEDHARGEDLSAAISKMLTLAGVTLDGTAWIQYSRPRYLPFVFPRSPGGLLEYSVNFDYCAVVNE